MIYMLILQHDGAMIQESIWLYIQKGYLYTVWALVGSLSETEILTIRNADNLWGMKINVAKERNKIPTNVFVCSFY